MWSHGAGTGRDPVAILAGAIVVLATTATVGLAVVGVFGLPTAVRTGFVVLAAALALVVYLATRGADSSVEPPARATLSADRRLKAVVGLGCLAVTATVLTGDRLLALLAFLPVGYLLVADGVRTGAPAGPTLASIATLLAVPALTKYRTTGFYFGGTDTFAHVDGLNRLLSTGSTAALPHGYDFFPGFHLFVGAVSTLGGLAPYDAIVSTGIAAFTVFVPTAYLFGYSLFGDHRIALAIALAVTVFDLVAYHALYFFPQALAFVLVAVGAAALAISPSARTSARLRRYSVYSVALVVILVSIHHLTYTLFLLPVIAIAALAALAPTIVSHVDLPALAPAAAARDALAYRWTFPVVFATALLATYLVYSPSGIVFGIGNFAAAVASGFAGEEPPATFFYGAAPVVDSVARGTVWLRTPTGIYHTVFAAIVLVGGYAVLADPRRYARRLPLLAVGFASTVVFLPLPVVIPQVERIAFVLVLFAIVPVGIGIARTLEGNGGRRAALIGLVVVATLGTGGALTQLAADDVEGVYLDERGPQTTMSDGEYAAVTNTGTFLDEHAGETASSDYVTRRAVESAVAPTPMNDELAAGPEGLSTPSEHLVVRERWSDHLVQLTVGEGLLATEQSWFSASEPRIDRELAGSNVVHDGGGAYVVADPDGHEDVLGGDGE